ncbi:hypothetical protein J4Q44_G00133720 [Coregonus suidteri]|uniref:Phospholipid/glycerol acyltransferase domain-containing protein n=1 Tax=Coregonus suidteri TaxID=861788 RepID=A0AAN8LS83_9TELE
MPDKMSFCRRGVEIIVDDEVTMRFSAQELESWNLLTRSNYNFHHISLRLSVLCENKPKKGEICVANHTTPIAIIILANDGCFSMVGQIHGDLIGVVQRTMVKSSPHIWFTTKHPIIIFPEGTCINNTSVMMFKKGSFEIDCTIPCGH